MRTYGEQDISETTRKYTDEESEKIIRKLLDYTYSAYVLESTKHAKQDVVKFHAMYLPYLPRAWQKVADILLLTFERY